MSRAKEAQNHVEMMEKLFKKDIIDSVEKSRIFEQYTPTTDKHDDKKYNMHVEDLTTYEAATDEYDVDCITVLNFASFTNPGGGYITGAMAQEEAICADTNLWNILNHERFNEFYEYNREHKNDGLYEHRCIWTPNVKFMLTGDYAEYVDAINVHVITCAAPNNYKHLGETNSKALKERAQMIIDVHSKCTYMFKKRVLILGAWGCGVFGQDPIEVANAFVDAIKSIGDTDTKYIFAIPKGKNYDAFCEVIK